MQPEEFNPYDALLAGVSWDLVARTLVSFDELRTIVPCYVEEEAPVSSYVPTVNAVAARMAA